MSRSEAVALVAEISRRWWREYTPVLMWHAAGQYKVILKVKATNTQFETFDPHWVPAKERVTA